MSKLEKKPILLFELGHLQVFHYQTIDEWAANRPIEQVYWQKRGENIVYGPFETMYLAVQDYSAYIEANKEGAPKLPDNVIQVDFKTKKRK